MTDEAPDRSEQRHLTRRSAKYFSKQLNRPPIKHSVILQKKTQQNAFFIEITKS